MTGHLSLPFVPNKNYTSEILPSQSGKVLRVIAEHPQFHIFRIVPSYYQIKYGSYMKKIYIMGDLFIIYYCVDLYDDSCITLTVLK